MKVVESYNINFVFCGFSLALTSTGCLFCVCFFMSGAPNKAFVCLFCCFTSQSTAMVMGDGQFTSPQFFLGKPDQAVNQLFVHILSLVTANNPS